MHMRSNGHMYGMGLIFLEGFKTVKLADKSDVIIAVSLKEIRACFKGKHTFDLTLHAPEHTKSVFDVFLGSIGQFEHNDVTQHCKKSPMLFIHIIIPDCGNICNAKIILRQCLQNAIMCKTKVKRKERFFMIKLIKSGVYKGKDWVVYEVTNDLGMSVTVTNIGCCIMTLNVPDKNGKIDDIVLGYDTVEEYLDKPNYFGAVIGRVGNRIKDGHFMIDGREYDVTLTAPNVSLHGGKEGFDVRAFTHCIGKYNGYEALIFNYTSIDGEEGYPGDLSLKVVYCLTDDGELILNYTATTTDATPINITNHSFFNLAGHTSGECTDNIMWINADYFTDTDEDQNTNGAILPVWNTPLDFNEPTVIGERIDDESCQAIKLGKGYDHNYVLKKEIPGSIELCAQLSDPKSGRVMQVYTDQLGVQFYSGNFLTGAPGKDGAKYVKRSAMCLETQDFPNAVNYPHFPNGILRPGEVYDRTTIYRFTTEE